MLFSIKDAVAGLLPQSVQLSAAVIVMTPQKLAFMDFSNKAVPDIFNDELLLSYSL